MKNHFYYIFFSKRLPNVINNPKIKAIADKHAKTNAQVALKYAIQRGIGVIPKSITPERIKENMDIFDFTLDDSDMILMSTLEEGASSRIVDYAVFSQYVMPPF